MKIVVTGARGFIARNLLVHLAERGGLEVRGVSQDTPWTEIEASLAGADFVFHLAGVNRPDDPGEFATGNGAFTGRLCDAIRRSGARPALVYASSIQAERDNAYGNSKRTAEEHLLELHRQLELPVHIYRLPNVFGKWARPNYNSAVATFCHNVANDLPLPINDASAPIRLAYIDDVVRTFLDVIDGKVRDLWPSVEPEYVISVGALAEQLEAFKNCRSSLVSERVGAGLVRALYATYVSYLAPAKFAYTLPQHADNRGTFVEMLKTQDSGQFSFFTAHPGVTRGGHYHHTKTEKFLVLKGKARFGFSHITSGERHEIFTDGAHPMVVETVPGWTHDIANIGEDEMVVMLWANEIFDRERPDTYARKVER